MKIELDQAYSILEFYLKEDPNLHIKNAQDLKQIKGRKPPKRQKTAEMSAKEVKQMKIRQKCAENIQQYEDLITKAEDPEQAAILK